eukprot:scaffold1517_cov397-Prasinococcus_capsulatus_cf.AAC.11
MSAWVGDQRQEVSKAIICHAPILDLRPHQLFRGVCEASCSAGQPQNADTSPWGSLAALACSVCAGSLGALPTTAVARCGVRVVYSYTKHATCTETPKGGHTCSTRPRSGPEDATSANAATTDDMDQAFRDSHLLHPMP